MTGKLLYMVYLMNGRTMMVGGVFTDIPRALDAAKSLIHNEGIKKMVDTARIEPDRSWKLATLEGWIYIEPVEVDQVWIKGRRPS